ncbi:hypothetical protein BX600DRAFT_439550 [Xylariales sp. PMI_506]|nr:hypothetical protein BX600DRAFT_439550 [Xylariales sp. PMI_506]
MSNNGAVKAPAKEGLGDVLYAPEGKAKVDIVFVHGLGGDRIDTWTWKGSGRTQFWPKTLLPKDCPTARILSFGYNADFAHFYPQSPRTISPELTIDNYSTSLLAALVGLRGKEDADRPIIFVAHSLGGLVVVNALSQDHGTDDAAKSVADHTIGTLFLGTPFAGSSKAKYGILAVNLLKYFMSTQNSNLKDLEERSEKLTSINDAFATYLKKRDREKPHLEVACFFEEKNLYKGSAKIGIIVPQKSATWLGIKPVSIPKDHIEMCKFDDEDGSDYKSVAAKLREWVENSDKAMASDGVGGLNAQTINVTQSGDVDYSHAHIDRGVALGHVQGTAPGANVITGSVNHYGRDAQKG